MVTRSDSHDQQQPSGTFARNPRGLTLARSLMLVPLWAFCAGCGSEEVAVDRPKTVPVTGTISYQKKPLSGAKVAFVPVSTEGNGAVGQTNENGEFTLMTFEPNDGARPGTYKVTVTKVEVTGELTENSLAPPGETKALLPEKFGVPRTSGLDAEVAEGKENKFEFNLE